MTDKIILTVIGLEWLIFGLIGLISPVYIAALLDMQLGSSIGYNELRAMYAFFTCMGFTALLSLWNVKLKKTAYLLFCIVLGCFLIGRVISFIFDGAPTQGGIIIFINELIVYALVMWRYRKREVLF
mgnify:FL=1